MAMSKARNSSIGCDVASSRSHSPTRSCPIFPNDSLKESFLRDGRIPISMVPERLEPKLN